MDQKKEKVKNSISEEWLHALRDGATLLHPTDTIWAIATAAFSRKGVNKLYELKQKPSQEPLILLVSDAEMLQKYVTNIPPRIQTLLEYVERPLTLVYRQVKMLPERLLYKDGSIAIRVVNNENVASIIRSIGQPLVTTSANLHGQDYAKSYFEIDAIIKNQVDYIFYPSEEPNAKYNEPSVIASFDENGELDFIRT